MLLINQRLEQWILSGGSSIGQISISQFKEGGGYTLRHLEDVDSDLLERFSRPEDAREIAKYDAAGNYRPLKSAPTLKRGWKLDLGSLVCLRHALDYFYPAAVSNWASFQQVLPVTPSFVVPLMETLGRQTGMYRITSRLTEEEAQHLTAQVCTSEGKCLRKIAWPIAAGQPIYSLPADKLDCLPQQNELPVICCEACPIFIGAARETVKARNAAKA
jgi:sirohydrochlorin cobaltochelatase